MARIRVRDTKTGKTGTIEEQDFSSRYERIGTSTTTPTYGASPYGGGAGIGTEVQRGVETPQETKPLIEKLSSFIRPRATQFAKEIGTGLGLGRTMPQVQESQEAAYQTGQQLQKRAMQETDPEMRARMLNVARESEAGTGRALESLIRPSEQVIKDTGEDAYKQYLRQAMGLMGEQAAYSVPTLGAQGGGVLQSGLRGALTAGTSGALYGATSPEQLSLGERVGKTAAGGAGGAAIGGGVGILQGGTSQLFDYVTDKLPKTLRMKAFKSETFKDEKIARESLERGAPGNYKDMYYWADDVYKITEDELQDRLGNVSLTPEGVFGNDPRQVDFAQSKAIQLADDLKSRGNFDDADRVRKIAEKIAPGNEISGNEWNFLKRKFDDTASTTFGKVLSDVRANKVAGNRNVADRIRDAVRNRTQDTKIANLLDTESFTLQLKDVSEAAHEQLTKGRVPDSWFQWKPILPLLLGGAGYATTRSPAVGVALGLGPLGIERLVKSPQTARTLYGAGQAQYPQAVGGAAKALTDWLSKRGAMEIAR